MIYRNRNTGEYPVTHLQIRKENPNTSFGDVIPPETAKEFGYDEVVKVDVPQQDGYVFYEGEPVEENGVWKQTWIGEKQIPTQVTRLGAIVALDAFQLLDTVEVYMSLESTPRQFKLAWKNAIYFERDSGVLVEAAKLLNLSEEDIDSLFIYANKVKL